MNHTFFYWTTVNFNTHQSMKSSVDDWRKSRMQGDILHEQLQQELINLCKLDGINLVESGSPGNNERLKSIALNNANNIFFQK